MRVFYRYNDLPTTVNDHNRPEADIIIIIFKVVLLFVSSSRFCQCSVIVSMVSATEVPGCWGPEAWRLKASCHAMVQSKNK